MKNLNNIPACYRALRGCGIMAQDARTLPVRDGTDHAVKIPALTGMFENADFRMTSNVRSQWNSLSSSFLTTGFAYDISIQQRFGAGLYMTNYNQAGIVNTFQIGTAGAYNVSEKNAHHSLSIGVHLGMVYKKVNNQQLLWDSQYNGGYFDSDLPSGGETPCNAGPGSCRTCRPVLPTAAPMIEAREPLRQLRLVPCDHAGRIHPADHEERPTDPVLGERWSTCGDQRRHVLDPDGAVHAPRKRSNMINAGMLAEIGIMGTTYSAVAGCSYRVNDAIIAQVGLKHNNAAFRFSYDVNVSSLKTYTRKNGAFEFDNLYDGTHSGRQRRTTSSAF